jgi:hypothetical protein
VQYITKNVVLEKKDVDVVNDRVQREGLGPRGFSVALRLIIREWNEDRGKKGEDRKNSSTRKG